MSSLIPLTILIIPMVIALFCLAFAPFSRSQKAFRKIEKPALLIGTGGTFLFLIYHAPAVFQGTIYDLSWAAMQLDSTNIAPLLVTALIFFLTSIFNVRAERGGRLQPPVYDFFTLTFLVCMLGLMLVYDLFAIALFIELVIVVSVVMVAHNKGKEAVEASFKYLIITAISALFIILGVIMVYVTAQTSNIHEILANPGPLGANPTLVILIAVCFIVGLGADIGIAPFHGWLPDAFPASTPIVNCFFAAEPIALFIALYRLLQPLNLIVPSAVIPALMIGVGIFSLVFGAILAYAQKNFMRLVAYATIEEFGYITIIFGLFTPLSYAVGQLYLMNVSIMKLGMLLALGSVLITTGSMDMKSLGGLGKKMQITSGVYLITILSLAGIAPLSGFFTKWFLLGTVYQSFLANMGLLAALGILLLLLTTSLFAFVFLIRSYHWIFSGPMKESLRELPEVPRSMLIPAVITVAILVFFGLMPHLLMAFIT